MQNTAEIIGASCIGTKEAGIPNQDAWLTYKTNEEEILIVCDGLGSSIYSDKGAKLACQSVLKIIGEKNKVNNFSDLGQNILEHWTLEVIKLKGKVEDYRTTCLFVIIDKKLKKICTGQIGDGLIIVKTDQLFRSKLESNKKDFLNETSCLGEKRSLEFYHKQYDYKFNYEILLVSDGIGDDIDIEKIDGLFYFLRNNYENIEQKERNKQLEKDLLKTTYNKFSDDKTLVFTWTINQ